jgi:hypothetical protein
MAISKKSTRVLEVTDIEITAMPSDFNVEISGFYVEVIKYFKSRNSRYQAQILYGVF